MGAKPRGDEVVGEARAKQIHVSKETAIGVPTRGALEMHANQRSQSSRCTRNCRVLCQSVEKGQCYGSMSQCVCVCTRASSSGSVCAGSVQLQWRCNAENAPLAVLVARHEHAVVEGVHLVAAVVSDARQVGVHFTGAQLGIVVSDVLRETAHDTPANT